MLHQMIGCRLESVKRSKMSWTLEFEGEGPQPNRYMLTSSGAVFCAGFAKGDQTAFTALLEALEDELVEARYESEKREILLQFRGGARVKISNRNAEGGDNCAIVTNVADGSWELYG